jgi:hypothetical protein
MSLFLIVLSTLIGCSGDAGDSPAGKTLVEPDRLVVLSPQVGRDAVLTALNYRYDLDFPLGSNAWIEKEITPQGVTTSAAYEFSRPGWIVSVVFRIGAAEEAVYRLVVTDNELFKWEGTVDAFGEIIEYNFVQNPSFEDETLTPSPNPSHTQSPTHTQTPDVFQKTKTDPDYFLMFNYPSSWTLTTIPAGRNTGTGFSAKILELTQDNIKLVIQYKFNWEITELITSVPNGDIEIRRLATLMGLEFPLKFVVNDEKVIYQFFDAKLDDMDIHIHVETKGVEIPEVKQIEAEQIVASITRFGDPVPSPTVSLTPKPTSKWGSTRSGSGDGSLSDEDCNKANFVAHVTIPEGSILPPGVKFTKTWRIQNVGTCTWTSAYKLVFSTGDLLGSVKAISLPESVPPGTTVDISIELTAPDEQGHYQGYWIFNDPQGYWFGLGVQKNGFILVDIIVALPDDIYAYDFAYNYCDAIWVNNAESQLPCPGNPDSISGFVVLVLNPELESRNEDELTLWVHPNEERNGWVQGIYPAFKILSGDRFKAWVGCMADSAKCSLMFHLEYLDADGNLHSIKTWTESYDGQITIVDLDLSALAGQTVQFILRTEGLTKNVTAAQGFWFVPRIERP